ncbi:MAG: aspartate/glutamate racemase family protein [Calditrichaeota bacterium]|nr:aspartate/glutamate racemase family protein [Calditrichota bacterium]
MKTIGLIGGMSWQSSKSYYEFTNMRVKELIGGSHSAKSIMVSVNFSDIERYTFQDNWIEIGRMMVAAARQLEHAGADIVLLCTNTIHLISEAIVESISVPFLHIADATGKAIQAKRINKIALLGTKFTMEMDFYRKTLEDKYHIDVLIPDQDDRQIVHDIIYSELVKGIFTEESKQKCLEIIRNLKLNGAEGVILGCTELPLLIPESDLDIPSFDTAKIHANQAVDWALK